MNVKNKLIMFITIVLCLFFKSTAIRAEDGLLGGSIPKPPGIGIPLSDYFNDPNGNAIITGANNSVLQMTNSTSQVSSIWSKDTIDLFKNFTFEAYIYMGKEEKLGDAADGITFSLIDSSLGNHYLGDKGSALGIYNTNKNEPTKNVPGITVEFDTYYNGDGLDSKIFSNGSNQQNNHSYYDHMAITNTDEIGKKNLQSNPNDTWGNWNSSFHYGLQFLGDNDINNVSPYTSLSDGNWKKIIVTWTFKKGGWGLPSSGTVTYELQTINGAELAYGEHEVTLGMMENAANVKYQTPSKDVYWGFTAATGDHAAENLIAITRMPTSPQVEQVLTTDVNAIEQNQELEININNKKVSGDENWTNVATTLDLSNLEDFEYISGSAKKNNESIADPIIDNDKKTLTFGKTDSIADSETISLKVKPKFQKEGAKINSWAVGDQTSTSANTIINVIAPDIIVEVNDQTYNVGTDINSVRLKDFVKNVKFNGNLAGENEYKVELIDKSFSLDQVGNFTAKVRVTSINNSSQTIDIDVPVVVLWGHTIVAKNENFSKVVSSVSMLDNNGVPKLVANKGNGLSTTNYLGSLPALKFYDQKLNNPKKTIGYSTVNQSATSLMNLWNEQLKLVNSSLGYGDVISFTVQKYANSSQNYNGANTWVSKNEQLIKEAGGYTEAYYELTTTGLKLLHINQLITKTITVPIYSTTEYLNKHVSELIDLRGFSNISIKGFSEYPETIASGQQKAKVIVEETLSTGKKVQYEYEVIVTIGTGEVGFTSIPEKIEFGKVGLYDKKIVEKSFAENSLVVTDNRGVGYQGNYQVQASVTGNIMSYLGVVTTGNKLNSLNNQAQLVYTSNLQANPTGPQINDLSNDIKLGVQIADPGNLRAADELTGVITWTIINGPTSKGAN